MVVFFRTKQMKKIIGYYSEYGYQVCELDKDVLYTAGNNKYCSEPDQYAPKEDRLSLEEIKNHCIQTAKEIAQEKGGQYVGVEFDKEFDDTMKNLESDAFVDEIKSLLN